jgi:hypothetical protein
MASRYFTIRKKGGADFTYHPNGSALLLHGGRLNETGF